MIDLITTLNLKLLGATGVTTDCLGDSQCETGLPGVKADSGSAQTFMQIIFGVIGAMAVLVIVIAALKYVTAQGDPQSAATARRTMTYAIVGLVIAVSAEIIVTFVLKDVLG